MSRPQLGPFGPISPYSPTYLPLYRPITFQPRLICSSCRWSQFICTAPAKLQDCSKIYQKIALMKSWRRHPTKWYLTVVLNGSHHNNCDDQQTFILCKFTAARTFLVLDSSHLQLLEWLLPASNDRFWSNLIYVVQLKFTVARMTSGAHPTAPSLIRIDSNST